MSGIAVGGIRSRPQCPLKLRTKTLSSTFSRPGKRAASYELTGSDARRFLLFLSFFMANVRAKKLDWSNNQFEGPLSATRRGLRDAVTSNAFEGKSLDPTSCSTWI